jgi:hypothetical protein
MAWVARAIGAAPRAIVLAGLALTTVCIWRVQALDASWIESDFSRLRRSDTWDAGEGYWGRRMEALLGTYLTPTVLLADDVPQARALAAKIARMREAPPLSERVASVRTIDDVIAADQPAKIAEVRAIRELLTPRVRSAIPPEQLRHIDRLLDGGEAPVTGAELPPTFVAGLRERDGQLGREVLVFPRPSRALWLGPPLQEFVDALRAAARAPALIGGRPARVAGSLPLSADILASIRRDGPIASAVALLGVIAAVFVILGLSRAGALVIASLVVAVLWLVAGAMFLGIRINFANFIAFPITFGIGVDYAVNVVCRRMQRPRGDIGEVLRSTGGAVALCSLTTILGYSSLLMAKNRGLLLFGVIAVLGEVCCLTTAVVILPAVLAWAQQRSAESRPKSLASPREHVHSSPAP